MKVRLQIISILSLLLTALHGFANVQFSGSAPAEVQVGQQFRLVYSINAEAENFVSPQISDFAIISGPAQSSSSNIQIINNQVTRTFSYSFTFTLAAAREGTYTIPPAKVRAGGKEYTSNAVTVKVRAASAPQAGQQQQGQDPGQTGLSSRDVFLRATVDKTNPFQGEQIIVTYKLYTRVQVSNYHIEQSPAHTGFWAEELQRDRNRLVQYTDVVDGQQYTVAEIRKVALFPQRSGTLRIDPLQVEITARIQQQAQRRRTGDPFFDSFFDDAFFGSRLQNVNHTLRSNAVNIEVKPLPVQNRPADFGGAVGNFSINAKVDNTELAANEPINLTVTINGTGNVRLIDRMNFQFPPSFEVYDPKITTDVRATDAGVSGRRTIEYLLIPRSSGNYTIKPAAFSFFNPAQGRYVSLQTPEFTFNVARGEGGDMVSGGPGADQQAVQYLARDIRFIRQGPVALKPAGVFFFGSRTFYILLISPVVLFALFVLLWRNHIKNNSDIARVKNRRATRIAKKRLKQASEFMKLRMSEKFFNELAQAMWGYISDKMNIPLSELSLDNVRSRLKTKALNEELIAGFSGVLEQCEFARFAPGEKQQLMDELYNKALDIITRIEKDLKQ